MQSKPHVNAKDLAWKFPLHTKLAQIRFTIRANARTFMASKRCRLALWGFTWLAVDMQIAPSKADDMRSTAKSFPRKSQPWRSGMAVWRSKETREGDRARSLSREPNSLVVPEASGALDCCVSFWVYWASDLGC
ncbi:hypothetical protein F383_20872 [Gossypium arboreum]|uniref:Uncharacterized protein n=1 Tax=Gossypium arboreum TaxID=29729 RepID=A0A0B0NWN3_GOSAR|nr:hypothetical protein F383_20872 [Gossypium arboreum]